MSPEGALHIARNLGGKGFLFVVNNKIQELTQPERAEAFLKALKEADISLKN